MCRARMFIFYQYLYNGSFCCCLFFKFDPLRVQPYWFAPSQRRVKKSLAGNVHRGHRSRRHWYRLPKFNMVSLTAVFSRFWYVDYVSWKLLRFFLCFFFISIDRTRDAPSVRVTFYFALDVLKHRIRCRHSRCLVHLPMRELAYAHRMHTVMPAE